MCVCACDLLFSQENLIPFEPVWEIEVSKILCLDWTTIFMLINLTDIVSTLVVVAQSVWMFSSS